MRRPLRRRQALQNARFLAALARTGNARLAARELGLNRSTFTKRRAKHPGFALEWENALACADRALGSAGGPHIPHGCFKPRTRGGEPHIVRIGRRLQLRRAPRGRITAHALAVFFDALAGTANVRVASGAAGFAHSSLLARARRDPLLAARIRATVAAAGPRIDEAEARALKARARAISREIEADPRWPEGMTVAQALRILGAPPMKLPGTPFPKRKVRGG